MAAWLEGWGFPIPGGDRCWAELPKKRIVPVVEAWPCQEGTVRERAAPGTNCPRKDRGEVSVIRHCPCSWAAQRISVPDYEFHMAWVWNTLWLCSTQEAAPGTASWESCVGRKQISEKKAAGRRIDADGIMWWKYLQSPASRAVDFCNSSRGLKWQKVWSLLMNSIQKTLPELAVKVEALWKLLVQTERRRGPEGKPRCHQPHGCGTWS